jgi:hypothetical protein
MKCKIKPCAANNPFVKNYLKCVFKLKEPIWFSLILFLSKTAFLFSKKAVVPSLKSSVPKHFPKFFQIRFTFFEISMLLLLLCQ